MIISMEQEEEQPRPKRFCCGSIKRLKEKCLRFHNNDELKCAEFIRGHRECAEHKRWFEGRAKMA